MAPQNFDSDQEMTEPPKVTEEDEDLIIPGLEQLRYNRRLKSTNPAVYHNINSEYIDPR